MGSAKEILVKPISAKDANIICKRNHYSGSVVTNSQLHLGVFFHGKCEGVMQFGPSLDKSKMVTLVRETGWNGFIELNRMAFSDKLPRNSESRALSIAFKIIKRNYPQIKWVVSFSDGAQCGDGTIYRASGFDLVGIKKNNQIIEFPDGFRTTRFVLTCSTRPQKFNIAKKYGIKVDSSASLKPFLEFGCRVLLGYQLKYIYFINKECKNRLTVPILPFSTIEKMQAGMYKGKPRQKQAMDCDQHSQRQCNTDLDAPSLEACKDG